MEIESFLLYVLRMFQQMHETKGVSWKWRLKVHNSLNINSKLFRNKGSLLKMEIESSDDAIPEPAERPKQRESPENGDWKTVPSSLCTIENSVKQRESPENGDWKVFSDHFPQCVDHETKGVSWKWRLKGFSLSSSVDNLVLETKGVSWKWRLKV